MIAQRPVKPKLSISEQIEHLSKNGVKFNISSKESAYEYLKLNNNYFKLTSYRKTFAKHSDGDNKDKYISLEFEYLKDLAIIDMRLRYVLLQMALDIEHFFKVRLLHIIENSDEDGYKIVYEYGDSLFEDQRKRLENELKRNRKNPYCGDIYNKYKNNYPVWAFIEIVPFGSFINFYKFCIDKLNVKIAKDDFYFMLSVKELRNACAHNNCILNDLKPNNTKHKTNNSINKKISEAGISKEIRYRKMSNIRIQQIVTLFYTHDTYITSKGVHDNRSQKLNEIITRMFLHIDYYTDNETINTSFNFLKILIDKWFPNEYNNST